MAGPYSHPDLRIEQDGSTVNAYPLHDSEEMVDALTTWRDFIDREHSDWVFEVHWPEWKQKRDGGKAR